MELVTEKKIYLNADGGTWIKSGMKRIAEAKEYIFSDWTAAKLRLRHKDGVKGSSTQSVQCFLDR